MATVLTTSEERVRARLELVAHLASRCAEARDMNGLFKILYEETGRVVDATVFLLSLYEPTSETVRVVRQIDRGIEHDGGSFPLGKGFTSEVIRTARPTLVRNWATEGPPIRLLYGTESGEIVTPLSAAIVPIILGDGVVGVLSVQSYEPEAYGDDELLTLTTIASQAAIAIAHLRLGDQMALEYQRHAEQLEAVLASMSDALVIVDARGAIVRLNRQARELLALDTTGIVLGQPFDEQRLEHLPPNAREVAGALVPIIRAIRAGTPVTEVDVELTSGKRRVLSVSATLLRTAEEPVNGGVIVFRDVTSQRDLERLREDVFAMAWHDMHTPITVIRGHASLLQQRITEGRRDRNAILQSAQLIVKHVDRLAELLTALFDIRCLQAGTLTLTRWPTELGALVRELADGLRETCRHELIVSCPDGIVGEWDERRVRQIMTNLIGNAMKYSSDGTTIAVAVSAEGGFATVSVRDEGIGLEPHELARLFHRGYRADRALNVRGGGLGLYLANGLVAAHGGRMWAESAGHGRGSTFSFTLPTSEPISPEEAE